MNIPQEYIVQKFYQVAGYPTYKKIANIYTGCCPTCREGTSWGKKRRLCYIPERNLIFCHNCGLSMSPQKWIQEVCGIPWYEIQNEIGDMNVLPLSTAELAPARPVTKTLPDDSINLMDETQVLFHNKSKVIVDAMKYINSRRLLTAVNRPDSYWISLTDYVHKNRIILPFYNSVGKIVFYQSRAIYKDDEYAKYLSKLGADKTVFGFDKISNNISSVFVFEGPFNSTFCKNGLAVGGIQEKSRTLYTSTQEEQMSTLHLFQKIWVLDNQSVDDAALSKSKILLECGETVFIWPKELRRFKDVNDFCVYTKTDEIPYQWIQKNSYSGSIGIDKLSKCRIT